ncbi:protein spaetzle isoform X2 [Drosophila yakuba]|uniref:Spz, isoform F n=1 Tax=Drosophila yakuba TaxID=7245 RepID=B4PRW1_DROYA|nr:protein spaetzle isoform X2 [Drosophila yakuba]EDW98554.2 spz, isoform F [Drosophila yakuba]
MMTPMWISLFKVLLPLLLAVAMIVYISVQLTKRPEAEVGAEGMRNSGRGMLPTTTYLQYEAKDYDAVIKSLFITQNITNDKGVVLFNTAADSAPFMPIPIQRDDPPQKQNLKHNLKQNLNLNLNQSPIPETNHHYHQYQSLIQPDQYFKVQRSPNGKLNLVFNDTFVSLQRTEAEMQSDQPSPPRHHSNFNQHTSQAPPHAQNDTKDQNPCSKGNMHKHKTFCTEVDDYPDISSLTQKLKTNFSKFFGNDFQPTDVGSRFGDADERFLCRSIRRTIQPKKGIKADNTWEFIINTDEYKQSIQIEECEGENQACDFAANFPQNYNPVCKQHYTQQTLASLKSDGKLDVVLQAFMIPSCCKCALKAV